MPLTVPRMEWQCRRIKAARAMRNKSAQQVADEIEISLTQYKRGESNARRWTPGELLVIARFLEVPEAWLLHENFDPFSLGAQDQDALARIEGKLDALTSGQAPASSVPDARNGSGTAESEGSQRRLHTTVRSESEERRKPGGGDRRRKSG